MGGHVWNGKSGSEDVPIKNSTQAAPKRVIRTA